MMKRALMAALCFSFVTLGSQAIDINIPGADPTISKDAYQNYRKSDATAKQMESDVNTMIRKQYVDNKPKNWSIDELVYFAEELNHSAGFSSSVFILKNDGANIKFTIPSGSRFGVTVKGDPMTTEVKRGNFIFNEGNLKYSIHKEKEGNSMANTFSYPTIKNGSWEVRQNQKGTLEGVLSFRMKADPSLSYQVAYDLSKSRELELLKKHNQEYVYKDLMSPLVNYVLPSIEPAKQVLSRTKPFTIKGFTFQTLKSSNLTYSGTEDDAIYSYDGKGYREGVMVRELTPTEIANKHKLFAQVIEFFTMYKPYSGYKPIQYATVWNDATPAIYMEVERSSSKMYIQSLYDDKYLYTHFIMTDLDIKIPSKELRDIVQYAENINDKEQYSKRMAGMSAIPKGMYERSTVK